MFGLPRGWGNAGYEYNRCPFCRDLVRGGQLCPCDLETILTILENNEAGRGTPGA